MVVPFDDGVGAVSGQQGVQERAEHAALRVRVEDVVLPIRTAWGLPIRNFRIQSQRVVLIPRSPSFEGTMVLNAEL